MRLHCGCTLHCEAGALACCLACGRAWLARLGLLLPATRFASPAGTRPLRPHFIPPPVDPSRMSSASSASVNGAARGGTPQQGKSSAAAAGKALDGQRRQSGSPVDGASR